MIKWNNATKKNNILYSINYTLPQYDYYKTTGRRSHFAVTQQGDPRRGDKGITSTHSWIVT